MIGMPVTLDDIKAAHQRIAGAILRTPCSYSLMLSRLCSCEVFCKLDHLQVTGSFKERGARNKLLMLSAEQRKTGIIDQTSAMLLLQDFLARRSNLKFL